MHLNLQFADAGRPHIVCVLGLRMSGCLEGGSFVMNDGGTRLVGIIHSSGCIRRHAANRTYGGRLGSFELVPDKAVCDMFSAGASACASGASADQGLHSSPGLSQEEQDGPAVPQMRSPRTGISNRRKPLKTNRGT